MTIPIQLQDYFQSVNPLDDPRFCDVISTELSETPAFVIVGCPQDIGVQRNNGRVGAALAPEEIRKQLYKLPPTTSVIHSQNNSQPIVDIGNVDVSSNFLEPIHANLTSVVSNLITNGHTPLVLGGGHDCAFANGRGIFEHAKQLQKTVVIINIDAHFDVRPLNNGLAHSGSPFRQLLEAYPHQINHFIEFGIQNFAFAQSHREYIESSTVPSTIYFYDDIITNGFQSSLQNLTDVCVASKADWIYLSIDMDAVQSAFAPGVSAPAAMGFTPNELLSIVKALCSTKKVRLLDIVEVNPTYDIDNRTSKLAAITLVTALNFLT